MVWLGFFAAFRGLGLVVFALGAGLLLAGIVFSFLVPDVSAGTAGLNAFRILSSLAFIISNCRPAWSGLLFFLPWPKHWLQ